MKAHDLAKLLLQCENFPVVIKSVIDESKAELIENVSILQNCDSPFDFAIFLEGLNQISLNKEVVIESL